MLSQLTLLRNSSPFKDVCSAAVPLDSTGSIVSLFGNQPGGQGNHSRLMWQPLRATFRPLARQPVAPEPPRPPEPPRLPEAPELPPEGSASIFSEASNSFGGPLRVNRDAELLGPPPPPTPPSPPPQPAFAAPDTTTEAPAVDDDRPTRVPLARFRPTRPPAVEEDPPADDLSGGSALIDAGQPPSSSSPPSGGSQPQVDANQGASSNNNNSFSYQITAECFECICEASTSCNPQSRCQTSDVRHTRCGMYLVSYDQWLESGLSRQLVTREQLARDVAADERAFYDCVTHRNCAQQVIAAYMQHQLFDCDNDGHLDCYDVAAIHQGGRQSCNSEPLLESQYWNEFNSCYRFAR